MTVFLYTIGGELFPMRVTWSNSTFSSFMRSTAPLTPNDGTGTPVLASNATR